MIEPAFQRSIRPFSPQLDAHNPKQAYHEDEEEEEE
jgi:hypothetical protein